MNKLWGEIPKKAEEIPFIDAKVYMNIKPKDVYVLSPLQQTSASSTVQKKQTASKDYFPIDPLVLHTIELLQYERELQSKVESLTENTSEDISPASPPPERELPSISKPAISSSPFTQNPAIAYGTRNLDSDFAKGIGTSPPTFDDKTRHGALRRAVAALCAHVGYNVCPSSVLDTLTDVAHHYLTHITRLLRTAVTDHALKGNCGFMDPIERVFQEISLGSPLVLHQYYQQRIIKYHNNVKTRCQDIFMKYETLRVQEEANRARNLSSPDSGDEEEPLLIPNPDGIDAESFMMQDLGIDILDSSVLLSDEDEKQKDSVKTDDSRPSEASASLSSDGVGSPSDLVYPGTRLVSPSAVKPPAKKRKR